MWIKALASLWTSTDPTGNQCDIGVEKDTGRFKIFDGTNPWTSLAYAAINAVSIHASASKTTPVDADELPLLDSATSFGEARLTWANLTARIAAMTATFTNKRITRRVVTVTQSATPAINTDNTDVASITGLAQAITSLTTNLTGTPVAGDELTVEITDSGTARAIAFGAKFEAGSIPLPTTTVASTKLTMVFRWNAVTSAWRLLQTSNYDTLAVTETNKTLTAPKIDVVATTGGSWMLRMTHGGSTNLWDITNSGVAGALTLGASPISGDANVTVNVVSKGTGAVQSNGNPNVTRVSVPATATSTGVAGTVAWDASFVYVCTATNTWVRAALATW